MKGVYYIFHVAVFKRVLSCELFSLEALKTNILVTDNALTASIDYDVKNVFRLSNLKAGYSNNAMGISKAMMENAFVAK